MNQERAYIIELIVKQLEQSLTADESAALEAWKNETVENRQFLQQIEERGQLLDKLRVYRESDAAAAWQEISKLIADDGDTADKVIAPSEAPVRRLSRWRWWAAASVFLILAIGGYWVFNRKSSSDIASRPVETDIQAPQFNRAMITLADGSKVFLDSITNGQLALQGKIRLVKLAGGQIAYQNATGQVLTEPEYNTLTNPRGSKVIDMQLSDGTHIWLNAGSSITYPVAFSGDERKVELKGEGYFEVAKDKTRKFIVSSNGVITEVLGTHFNVNAYRNEPAIKVTLLEGSVRTGDNNRTVVINPGQQVVAGNGNVKVNKSPNLDQVMAWKNGYFNFDGLTLKQAMTQLERWYDIDVVYEGDVEDVELVGKMTRDITLNGLMVVLQKLGTDYQLEGRKLTIK